MRARFCFHVFESDGEEINCSYLVDVEFVSVLDEINEKKSNFVSICCLSSEKTGLQAIN